MFKVYWTADKAPSSKDFPQSEMSAALRFTEALRSRQRAGEDIGFVTFCSENENCVGHPGVAEVGVGYNWKKRRL